MSSGGLLLAIDPSYGLRKNASRTGFALFHILTGKLLEFGEITSARVLEWRVRSDLLKMAEVLVIEGQFYQMNSKVSAGLVEARCRWTVPARDIYEMKVFTFQPQEWLSQVQRGWRPGMKKDQKLVRDYVWARFALESGGPDAISAIGMGAVFLDQERMGMGRLSLEMKS